MHPWVRRTLCGLGLTGGALLLGVAMAQSASADNTTSGQDGIGSGNQTGLGIQAPVNVTGNQITVIGHDNTADSDGGSATSGDTSTASTPTGGDNTTSGQDGIGSGNQTGLAIQAPVNASGNQITVIGHDNTATTSGDTSTASTPAGGDNTTSGQDGIGSGNQTGLAIQAPVNATGNQIAVVGEGNTTGNGGGSSVVSPPTTGQPGAPGGGESGGTTRGETSPPRSGIGTGSNAGPAVAAATLAPVAGVLPNTGAPAGAGALAALALLLLLGGALLLRRREVLC